MDTQELRALLAAGTAGEWCPVRYWPDIASDKTSETGKVVAAREDSHEWPTVVRPPNGKELTEQAGANARLIAALHNAAPLLLDVVEAAEAMTFTRWEGDKRWQVSEEDQEKLRTALEALHAAR